MANLQTVEFISPLGTTINFNDRVNYMVTRGKSGFHGQPFTIFERETPFVSGAVISGIQTRPRLIGLPVFVWDISRIAFLDRMRTLSRELDPNYGDGILRYTRPDGSVRQLTCRLSQMFDDQTNNKLAGPQGISLFLQFKAFDPYWYPTVATEASYGVSAPSAFFPFFPLNVSPDGLSGGTILNNPGDAPAWPVWTLYGPGSDLAFINNTTGYTLEMSTTSIILGETLVIDTRPGIKTAEVDGVSVFDEIDSTSTLWPLVIGDNDVELQLTGATGSTSVEVYFFPPYNSA